MLQTLASSFSATATIWGSTHLFHNIADRYTLDFHFWKKLSRQYLHWKRRSYHKLTGEFHSFLKEILQNSILASKCKTKFYDLFASYFTDQWQFTFPRTASSAWNTFFSQSLSLYRTHLTPLHWCYG